MQVIALVVMKTIGTKKTCSRCFLRTGFTCAHLKSSGNKPEQSDACIMSVIGLIKTSRHAFSSTVGSGSSQDMTIFLTSAVVAGSNDAS